MNEHSRNDVIANMISQSSCMNTVKLVTSYGDSDTQKLQKVMITEEEAQ